MKTIFKSVTAFSFFFSGSVMAADLTLKPGEVAQIEASQNTQVSCARGNVVNICTVEDGSEEVQRILHRDIRITENGLEDRGGVTVKIPILMLKLNGVSILEYERPTNTDRQWFLEKLNKFVAEGLCVLQPKGSPVP